MCCPVFIGETFSLKTREIWRNLNEFQEYVERLIAIAVLKELKAEERDVMRRLVLPI
jgi:hypothetical protein